MAPPSIAPSVDITPSPDSKSGLTYNTADGTKIANLCEKVVTGVTDDEQPISMAYQMAEVTRPLCSVGKICDGQKLVAFGPKGGYIQDRWSGVKHPFQQEGGIYVLRTWIPRRSESEDSGFSRQG